MAKNPASFQKRQRELDKKRKADDKRKRRLAQKQSSADRDNLAPDGEKPLSPEGDA